MTMNKEDGQRKIDNIFIERKSDVLISCKQIFNCWVSFLKYLPNKTPIFKDKIVPNSPRDAQCRFLLEVKKMPQ